MNDEVVIVQSGSGFWYATERGPEFLDDNLPGSVNNLWILYGMKATHWLSKDNQMRPVPPALERPWME